MIRRLIRALPVLAVAAALVLVAGGVRLPGIDWLDAAAARAGHILTNIPREDTP